MLRKTMTATALAFTTLMVSAGPVLAVQCNPDIPTSCVALPGPGVFPLIALGIAGAIALAKLRK